MRSLIPQLLEYMVSSYKGKPTVAGKKVGGGGIWDEVFKQMDAELDDDDNIGSTNTRPTKRTTTASELDGETNMPPWRRNRVNTFGATENNSNMGENPPPHTARTSNDPGMNTDDANQQYSIFANKELERLEKQREEDRAAANKNRDEIASSAVYNREYIRHAKNELERLEKQREKDQAATNKTRKERARRTNRNELRRRAAASKQPGPADDSADDEWLNANPAVAGVGESKNDGDDSPPPRRTVVPPAAPAPPVMPIPPVSAPTAPPVHGVVVSFSSVPC